ncbi:MAG: D-aminoacyl-tRNA deacylase [Candidatus Gracilibacteria bacterium]|nr:D-aminoacyl-tRNA deacylase [Candidatus Gracilibacteria bacterium]
MRALIQRVSSASVTVEDSIVGQIAKGVLVLLGITNEDTEKDLDYLVDKITNLRIFPEGEKEFDLSLLDIEGQVLAVSQFTLYADTRKGRRPSFVDAAKPEFAKEMYEKFVAKLKETGLKVETGTFQAMMNVESINEGPVTLWLDSKAEGTKN